MPNTKKPHATVPPSDATRNAEGYLLLKDGSTDGRSLRTSNRGRGRRFMVRVEPTFPQEVKLIAARTGKTMGQVVQEAVRAHFAPKRPSRDPQPG